MKVTIQKNVSEEVEVIFPIYRKRAISLTRIDNEEIINVYDNCIMVYRLNERELNEYYPLPECSKEEFTTAFEKALTSIIDIKNKLK